MEQIKDYFSTKALSNSMLGLMFNPRWVKLKRDNPDNEDEETSYFRIGSALDCLLTSPERWDEDFKVIAVNRPFGLMGKFIDNLPPNLTIFSTPDNYQEAYDKAGYKMKIERVIDNFWRNEETYKYYQVTREIKKGVSIISKDEYDTVVKCKELIDANEFIYPYFHSEELGVEILRQVPIYFNYMGEDCKGLLDGIKLDHRNRTIQPYDLKTTGKSVYDFRSAYLQYGYYRQASFYELALYSEASPVKKYIDEGYTMLDFVFIVVETKLSSSHPAIIFRTSLRDRQVGLAGGYIGSRHYKGINNLIEDYQFYTTNDYWDLPRDLFNNKGEILLRIFDDEEQDTEEYVIPDVHSEYSDTISMDGAT